MRRSPSCLSAPAFSSTMRWHHLQPRRVRELVRARERDALMVDTTLVLPLRGRPAREVLLGYKRVGFGAGKLTGVGGKIEAGETAATSAARELAEEVGLHVQPDQLELAARLDFRFPFRPDWSTVMYVFCTWSWQGMPAAGREIVPAWYAVAAIPYGEMWADTEHWLPRVLGGERVRGLFYFAADNETVAHVEVCALHDAASDFDPEGV